LKIHISAPAQSERLERLDVKKKSRNILGSNPTSSDTVESDGRQMKKCKIKYIKRKNLKNSPLKKFKGSVFDNFAVRLSFFKVSFVFCTWNNRRIARVTSELE
jgi:hypothetical protein